MLINVKMPTIAILYFKGLQVMMHFCHGDLIFIFANGADSDKIVCKFSSEQITWLSVTRMKSVQSHY